MIWIRRRSRRIDETLLRLRRAARCSVRVADAAARTQPWWDGTPFDGILLDAPCSASCVVRRHPDIRWLRRESDIDQLAMQQAMLLGQYETIAFGEHTIDSSRGYRYLDTLLSRVVAVTADDVATVAQRYLTEDNRTVGYLINDQEAGAKERDRAA